MTIEDAVIMSLVSNARETAIQSDEGPVRADVFSGLATLYQERATTASPWIARRTFPIQLQPHFMPAFLALQGAVVNASNIVGDAIDYGDYKTPRYLANLRIDKAKHELRQLFIAGIRGNDDHKGAMKHDN